MSNFYRAFRDHTQTIGALTALVGARVHSIKYPQSPTYPAIRVTRIGNPLREMSHSGETTGIFISTYQIETSDSEEVTSDPQARALSIARLLEQEPANDGFSGFTGLLGVSPDDLQIGIMMLTGQFDTYDPEELRVFRAIQTWRVQHCRET